MTPHRHACALGSSDRRARDLGALFRRCSTGDAQAREAIIVLFLPLARRLVRSCEERGEPLEDLVQVASVGVIHTVDRYAPERGDGFSSYARPMIVVEIRRHFRDTTWRVHVPRQVRDRAALVLRAGKELTAASGAATAEAVAKYFGVRPELVAEARSALQADPPQSLDSHHMSRADHALALSKVIGADAEGTNRPSYR